MDNVQPILREKPKIRDEEFSRYEAKKILENTSREREIQNFKDQNQRYAETIGKNLNFITSRRHAISKVLNESKQCEGLPISNKYHKPTLDFINDAVTFLNNGKNLFTKSSEADNIDTTNLNTNVQSCAQSTSDVFKGTQSSVIKVETLMQNMHVVIDQYNEDEPALERSIFDE